MEWTWLRDWWRLKKIKAQRISRRKKKAAAQLAAQSHSEDDHNNNYDDDDDDSDDGDDVNETSCSANINDGDGNKNEHIHQKKSKPRRKSRSRTRRGQANKVDGDNAEDDANNKNENNEKVIDLNNDDDDDDEDDCDGDGDHDEEDDDDEGDDFCYCDECLNGDTDLCDSNDGMDSDCSTCSNSGKQVIVGICAMAKKTQSKPMKEIITRLQEFEFIKTVIFEEEVILKQPVENWPICDCLVSFHSKGFPLEKAIQYAQLRKPYVLNNLHMQYDIQDRRRVYAILQKEGIEIPRYAVLDRDSPNPKQHELIESEDHVEVNGTIFNKPFVEKPVSAEDHNIYIYYPTSAGGGSQRLFRKIGSRSSVYSPESRVRKTGSFIYEDFMPTDGTDVKVYTVGPDYAHAEARKSPALDGKVERDREGKEIRYPVILNHAEKLISRKVCMAFKQTVCGFDLLRANGKSYVCDVNGFSFVKNSNKYYDDCAKILGNMILRELTPTLHIPWSVPFQLDDPPIMPTTFGKMMELRCVVAIIRHGDRTPKQKMKVEVRHPKFFEIFEKYDGYKDGHVKMKRPKQLQEILDIARFLLSEIESKSASSEVSEKQSKLEQLKNVLEMYGHFSGINRKVQMKYQPKGRPRGSSSDDGNNAKNLDTPKEPSLVLILKWGGELTPAGRIQAEELGRIFRCMYPGGQGRQDYSGTQGLGLLRLHSTFRHDLKIYASDEGRVQMTAAAFAKGLLALEGELTPILVQMVKSANTNGLLDNDCDSSKYQNIAKNRLHELMQIDRDFTPEDRQAMNPSESISINQALDFVKNPVECCNHVHSLIKELLAVISVKKEDPKTKDAILYHGETWDLMGRRWEKIEKDFSQKSKLFDISKIPDIYDCIKYDLQHNQHTLQYDQAEELYIYAKYLADIVIPQEYGMTISEKLAIGQGICTPLLKKIQADLQRNLEEVGEELVNRLNPHYSHGVASPERHVRTRLYFTSESHVHSLLTVLRHGGLLDEVTDEQWRRAMEYISAVSELNYMSQIVIMLYEDPTKDPTSEERFHVELHFSPGVNCCVQKNLPPGPGFRPHSRNDSTKSKNKQEESGINPPRIEEENDTEESPNRTQSDLSSPEEKSELCTLPQIGMRTKHHKSRPIPIKPHHTVSGHEAMNLAKRLNEELAQQQAKQVGVLETQRPISPGAEPRSRSYEQRDAKTKVFSSNSTNPITDDPIASTNVSSENLANKIAPAPASASASTAANTTAGPVVVAAFKEIPIIRVNSNPSSFQIRVTDSLTLFKIESSTNELPLSDIDLSHSLASPDKDPSSCDDMKFEIPKTEQQQKQCKLLSMHRMASSDERDFVRHAEHLPKISPLATNERPLSCNCLSGGLCDGDDNNTPHAHAKSIADIRTMLYEEEMATLSPISPTSPQEISRRGSYYDEFRYSSSAPSALLTGEFMSHRSQNTSTSTSTEHSSCCFLKCDSPTNSPTASTLKLCKDLEDNELKSQHAAKQARYASKPFKAQRFHSTRSAPIIVDVSSPFSFPQQHQQHQQQQQQHPVLFFVNSFAPIAEIPQGTPSINITESDPIDQTEHHQVHNPQSISSSDLNSNLKGNSSNNNLDSNPSALLTNQIAPSPTPTPILIPIPTPTPTATSKTITITIPNTDTDTTLVNNHSSCPSTTNEIDSKIISPSLNSNLSTTDNAATIRNSPHNIDTNTTNTSTSILTNVDLTTNITTKTTTTIANSDPSKLSVINSPSYSSPSPSSIPLRKLSPSPSSSPTRTILAAKTAENTVANASSSTSVSSRRQRHSIAGQMSYMKMLGFGGFSKKMATSSNSLFSTAVISGSSSAPNLRDMIPVSSTSVLEGFGGVPPIRPLETLHNALSLKQLDNFLQRMTTMPVFKTPGSTPKQPSTPVAVTAASQRNNLTPCSHCQRIPERGGSICDYCGRILEREPGFNVGPSTSSAILQAAARRNYRDHGRFKKFN